MTTSASFLDRHYFLLRRLHSLSGIFPIGLFLFPHLITNSSITWGQWLGENNHGHGGVETFQHEVNWIHNLPALIFIEWGVLFLPIAFHAVLGVWFARSGKTNVNRYPYQDNWRYTLQRLSGYLGVIFIFMHITSLRFGFEYAGLFPAFEDHAASSSTANHFQNGGWGLLMAGFYLLCVLALVFHFANGLWTAAITWGLTLTVTAQKRWGYICAGVGLMLAGATIAAVVGFSTLDIELAKTVEAQLNHSAPALTTAEPPSFSP